MRTTDLPGLSRPLPELALGTMTFGDTVDVDVARTMVDLAIDAGITSIDTANGYAAGRSEEMLGEILRGRRDQVLLATKAGIYPGDADGQPLLSRPGAAILAGGEPAPAGDRPRRPVLPAHAGPVGSAGGDRGRARRGRRRRTGPRHRRLELLGLADR